MVRAVSPLLLVALSSVAFAGFEPSRTPAGPGGVRATVDLPSSQHMKNTGGSDGLGLCVFTAIEHSARWQNIIDLGGYRRWMERRPGGGYPSKVDATLKAYCRERGVPVPDYVQHTGGDDGFLDLAMRTGRCPCVTYAGSDDFYRGGIDHMVNLVHLDSSRAAIIDNNRPGVWLWMTRSEFLQRWRARGGGWAVVFLSPPPPPHASVPVNADVCECGGVCLCEGCPDCRCETCSCRDGPPGGVFGQWLPGGACPAPSAGRPILRTPKWTKLGEFDYLEGAGLYHAPTGLWAPLQGGRWGEWQPLPKGIAPPQTEKKRAAIEAATAPRPREAAEEPLTGVIPERIHESPMYSLSGVPVSREEAMTAMGGGPLVDDSDRWHVTVVGDKAFRNRVKADIDKLPPEIRAKFHVQAYPTDHWAVSAFKLKEGVVLRKSAGMSRVASETAAIAAADYSAETLNRMCPHNPKPSPAPTPDEPQPQPSPAPNVGWWLVLAALAILAIFRRK